MYDYPEEEIFAMWLNHRSSFPDLPTPLIPSRQWMSVADYTNRFGINRQWTTGPPAGRTALLNASDTTLDSIDGKGMSGAYREETDR